MNWIFSFGDNLFGLEVILISLALLRYLRESENDTTTTYSDSQRRVSSSPSSIPPLTDVVDAQPATSVVSFTSPLYEPPPAQSQTSACMAESSPGQTSRRLAEFMIDFDRSRYV
ncbi:unnamed protein product [Angiostrongylus costaricensis]|uniref:Secreted protein n=1 Tax=Angiostrongylus costaricensis TaxID=334426 RepID=A0A0R3PZH2_ANGCS|nr:unnamed protein product [Angiostrongylus costaricensis]